jgi:hypothetical protein
MLSRLKFDLSDTISTMIGYIPESVWANQTTTFCDFEMGGGQFIKAVVDKLKLYGHSDENIQNRVFGFSDNELYLAYVMGSDIIGTFDIYKEKKHSNMKFDVIVGNPPYQLQVGPNKTETIWDKFVIKSFNHLKDDGYLTFVHPSGWRNVDGKYKDIQRKILSKNLIYLEIHNEKDGLKTFGAETRYDVYVLQNSNTTHTDTTIKFQDNTEKLVNIIGLEFIPNSDFDLVSSLVAKNNEESVELIHTNVHHTQKVYMSENKTITNKYECIYTVKSGDIPTFWYSPFNDKGHFGVPKLVFSNFRISSAGSLLDIDGKYGMCQFSSGIVDTIENLPFIKKAFDTPRFRKLMENCSVSDLSINYKLLSTFRKDFWKEFI